MARRLLSGCCALPLILESPLTMTAATPTILNRDRTSDAHSPPGSHAVVLGGSIAGLLTARVLLDHFDQVTLLERDQFPNSPEVRRGVPQGAHVHGLLMRGQQELEKLFPGLSQDLVQAGATRLDWINHWQFLGLSGWLEQHESGLEGLCCSRLLIEWYVRQRLLKYEHFALRPGCYAKGLEFEPNQKQVTGIWFQEQSDGSQTEPALQCLQTTLVVDTTGRQSKLPQWLDQLGWEKPPETMVNSFLGYASRWYKQPHASSHPSSHELSKAQHSDRVWTEHDQGMVLGSKPGESTRGGVLYPVEGNRWVVTLAGIAGDHPPGDEAGFMAFMKSLRDPILYERLKDAEPCSPIHCYRRTENQWRHYEQLPAMPAGLIALGDAVCCFNPVYGQGMTAAALGAVTLGQVLSQAGPSAHPSQPVHATVTSLFQKQLAKQLKAPWLMATGEDFRWSETVGKRPGWLAHQFQGYFDRIIQLSTQDAYTHRRFIEVAHLVHPPTVLFEPRIIWKVLTGKGRSHGL